MDLKQRIVGLEGPQAIEVTHLLFRYLTHRLDEQTFRKLFLAERPSRESERSYEIALAAIHDIETKERTKVQAFPEPTLRSYIEELAKASRDIPPAPMDPGLRERAERELELFRSL